MAVTQTFVVGKNRKNTYNSYKITTRQAKYWNRFFSFNLIIGWFVFMRSLRGAPLCDDWRICWSCQVSENYRPVRIFPRLSSIYCWKENGISFSFLIYSVLYHWKISDFTAYSRVFFNSHDKAGVFLRDQRNLRISYKMYLFKISSFIFALLCRIQLRLSSLSAH